LIFLGPATPCASPPPRPSTISDYYLLVHHHVNRDDRHLLAHVMASDFTAARQYSQIEIFCVTDQTPHPYLTRSFPAQFA
jgi:hypothetical protein